MKFKVYNGPLIPMFVGDVFIRNVEPMCTYPECRKKMCVWMSDRFCTHHAIEYVKAWDAQNANQNN